MRLEIMHRDDFLYRHCYCEGKTLELSIAQGRCDFAAEFAKALERGFTNVHLWDAIENYLASLEKEPVELEVVK